MDKNLDVLKEVCKGAKMGMDAISYVSEKIKDDQDFKNTLNHEYSMYNNILDKTYNAYSNYEKIPESSNIKDKAFLWYGIQINTIKDSTTTKLAELLVQRNKYGNY